MSKAMKGSMANYYHEARSQVKAMKERQIANKKTKERRQELEDAEKESPLHYLRLDARPCKLFKNDAAYYSIEKHEGLVPWSGQQDNLIDRYDVRSLLDMYVEPDTKALKARPKSAKELELAEMLAFEGYRDLIRLSCLGLTEAQGIAHAQEENVVLRAQAKAAATAAALANLGGKAPGAPGPGPPGGPVTGANAIPAGTGAFAAVGFNYGGDEGGSGSESDEGDGGSDGEDSEDEGGGTAEDVDMDRLAELFGVEDFSTMLRWAMRQEAAEAEANRNRPKRHWSRKKAALRAKRMAGQGLPRQFAAAAEQAAGAGGPSRPSDLSWIPERRDSEPDRRASDWDEGAKGRGGSGAYRDAPWHRDRDSDRSRRRSSSRSRSRSPADRRRGSGSGRPQMEFITEFSAGGGSGGPSTSGQPGGWPGAPGAGRDAGGVREALPGAADPSIEGPAQLPQQALRVQGVKPEDYRRDRGGRDQGGGGRGKSLAAIAAAEAARPVDKAKETPQERLKRLMAAQLNKKIQKDSVQDAQKKLQDEKEREARAATERLAYSSGRRSSDRDWGDSRQYDWRDRYGDRSRSRSRSRSPRYRSSHRDSDRYRRSPSPYSRRR